MSNQLKQIGHCIRIWDNRLRRREAKLRKSKETVIMQQQKYDQSIKAANEAELYAQKKIKQLNNELTQQKFTANKLTVSLRKEQDILSVLENKKGDILLYKNALEEATDKFNEIRKEVSIALKKKEKYLLITSYIR